MKISDIIATLVILGVIAFIAISAINWIIHGGTKTHYPYTQENLKACQQLQGQVVIRLTLTENGKDYMTCKLVYPEVSDEKSN